MVSSETYEYEITDKHKVYGLGVVRDPYDFLIIDYWDDCILGEGWYFNGYFHQTGQALLTSKTVTLCDDDENCITTTEDYEYNQYNQLTHISSNRSDGYMDTTIYTYPSGSMESRYIIAPVIRTVKKVGNKTVYNEYKEYEQVYTDMFRPEKIYQLETFSGEMEEKVHYNYNAYGKVSSLIASDKIPVVYLWSYKGQYPVAEIRNATEAQVAAALVGITPTALANAYVPDMAKVNALRAALPNAQVSTFTYQPLVGMTSATDPRGLTTYYTYDSSGRLTETYIMEGTTKKVIQDYDYNYKN
ncbi:RHS repeat domain-containing protein [Viscerimonas tarda]